MLKSLLICLLLFNLTFTLIIATEDIIIDTKYGKINGFKYQTEFGFKADVFLGIPYAKPPVDDLRFEKPQLPDKWDIINAHNYGSECIGHIFALQTTNATEDCLYMNIAKPSNPSNDPNGYPVMFWIHGGAFILGSSNEYHNKTIIERLVSKGIIFVSINYRLGPFGFLYDEENQIENLGLYDQIQGLKFLNQIIKDFNGNPDKITIFGESAGGSSVSWLTINPETKNLFNNAIIMSGSHHLIWANSEDTINYSKFLLENFNNDITALKNAKTEEILKVFPHPLRQDSINFNYWNPVLNLNYVNATTHREADQKSFKKDIIMGIVSQENMKFLIENPIIRGIPAKIIPFSIEEAKLFDEKRFNSSIKHLLYQNNAYGDKFDEVIDKIITFYSKLNKKFIKNKFLNSFATFMSDLNFNIGVLREARDKSNSGYNVYFYLYDFITMNNDLFDGVGHADELSNLFSLITFVSVDENYQNYHQNKDKFIQMFTSFVITDIPQVDDIKLNKINANNIKHVKFSNNGITFDENLFKERLEFWDNIAQEYGFDWIYGTWINKAKNINQKDKHEL